MLWIFLLLLLTAAFLLGGSFYAYRVAFYNPKAGRDQVKKIPDPQYDPYRPQMRRIYQQLKDRPYEAVSIRSREGLKLTGRYYHTADGAPLDICFHGYRSHPYTDFSGGSELSFQMGHNVLLIDQRAHGGSDGRTITFGIRERFDLLSWVEYGVERFGPEVEILLYGVSMGGATVLMAADLSLPPNVKGIVADCPFVSPLDIILDVGRKTMPKIPPSVLRAFALWGARIFGGFDLTETDARRAVEKARVPILILHGEDDRYVPCEMSDLTACNPGLVERHTFPGAAHGISYLVDTPRYQALVRAFVKRVLAKS